LVPVRQHQRADRILLELPQVGYDQVHPEQFRLGEHDAGIDQDGGIAAGDHHHVHAELAEPAERDDLERRHVWRYAAVVNWQHESPVGMLPWRRTPRRRMAIRANGSARAAAGSRGFTVSTD